MALTLALSACREDRSPKPAGAWTVIDEGTDSEVGWTVLLAESSRTDAVCLAVEVDPPPSSVFNDVDPATLYQGHSPGCVTTPEDDVIARIIRLSDGDDNTYGLLLGLVPDGTGATAILQSGQRVDNLVVDAEPTADPVLILFDLDDPPVELVVDDAGQERRCAITRGGVGRSNCASTDD